MTEPTSAVPAKPAPIPPASSHLPPEVTTPAAVAETPGDPPALPTDAKPDADPEVTSRLTRIAREQRRLEKAQATWKAEQAAELEAAAKWRQLQEKKTKGGRLAALDAMFEAGEVEGELYQELTERIYAKGEGQPLTPADVDKRVEEKLAAARKTEEDARTKAEQEATQAQQAEHQRVTGGYLEFVNASFADSKAQFPTLAAILEDFPGAVSGPDILKFTEGYFKEHQKAPEPAEIFDHFEAKLAKRFRPQGEDYTPPAGARSLPRGDASPKAAPKKTGKLTDDEWEAIKKQAGAA